MDEVRYEKISVDTLESEPEKRIEKFLDSGLEGLLAISKQDLENASDEELEAVVVVAQQYTQAFATSIQQIVDFTADLINKSAALTTKLDTRKLAEALNNYHNAVNGIK